MFVVGLPRSRTAWLSAFLSQSGTHFYHDGFNGCHSLDEYKEKIAHSGDCSTGLMLIDISKEFPEAKVVIVEKDNEQLEYCINWCTDTYGVESDSGIMELKGKLDNMQGLRINQGDIDNKLPEIWGYLLDTPWNDKYSAIKALNIQSDPHNIDYEAAGDFLASI